MRQRTLEVQRDLRKVKQAGEDMDGNHSDDECEFVDALKGEMPTVDTELAKLIN